MGGDGTGGLVGVGGAIVDEGLFAGGELAVEAESAVGEVDGHGGLVGGVDPVGGEQSVPENIAGVHFVSDDVVGGEVGGARELVGEAVDALIDGDPAGGVREAVEFFRAVDLPGDDVGLIAVVVGGAVDAGHEDDGVAAFVGETGVAECAAPGGEDFLFEAVEELAGGVEAGEFEVGEGEGGLDGLIDGQGVEPVFDVIGDAAVGFGAGGDAGHVVGAHFGDDAIDGREVEVEGCAGAGHPEVVVGGPEGLDIGPVACGWGHGGIVAACCEAGRAWG